MRFAYAESFHKTIRNLSQAQAKKLLAAVGKFESSWEENRFPQGVGLKHLRGQFFEFRADIHNRVLFKKEADLIYYLLYGSHDDIRRF